MRNSPEKIRCNICRYECKNIGPHLDHKHNISAKVYYDTYFKKNGDGICPTCNGETKFNNIRTGYGKFCSKKCMFLSEEYKREMHDAMLGHEVKDETREKISKSLDGHIISKRTRSKISKSKINVKSSLQTIKKISNSLMGHEVTEETRRKISKSHTGMKGKSPSLETRRKLSQKGIGRIASEDTKRKLRIALLNKVIRIREKHGDHPVQRGEKEIKCLDYELQEVCKYKIDTCFHCIGYFIDGYIHEINLAIEFDEKYHENEKAKAKDKIRQGNIKNYLKCKFFRIKEREWDKNREKVIKTFLKKIEEQSEKMKIEHKNGENNGNI
jgi:very-short-patch-repair endonuclease